MTQPRVEPEIALVLGADLSGDAARTRSDVLAALASAHACLEVVDSVWHDYRFRIEDNTADGSSAAGFVLGPELPIDSIADVHATLALDGAPVGSGFGRDAGGHPADGVVWLAAQLAAQGDLLHAGDVVLTGGLTAAVALEEGNEVRAVFGSGSEVSVSVRR
jgi:2-keto-4-pentenoate hydratase